MYLLKTILILFFCLDVITTQNDAENEDENLAVTINSGIVQGRRKYTVHKNKTYYSFQGIPFAEPPVDNLRFRAPVPVQNWEGILPTKDDENRCIQEYEAEGSEDCLYINVFTPDMNTTLLLPVMVWISGDAFHEASSKIKKYSPDYFLEEDVVVVTFNYRLGVFGFLSTEDLASPGNYGLKDQVLALHWVQDNIKFFGGSPKSVTIFGQSAGSASVSYLLQTPLTKNLFHRAIMQSGTSLNLWALTRNPRTTAFAIGKALDIDTDNSTVLVNALRRIETRTLQATSISREIMETAITNPRDGLVFGPTIEPNSASAVIRKKSHEKLNHGDFNRVPCIVGFNSEEGIPLTSIINFVRPYFFTYDIFSTRLVPIDMNIESNFQKIMVALLIKQKYFGFISVALSNSSVVQFVTDDQFVRPIYEYVSLVSKYTTLYFYRFSYKGKTEEGSDALGNKGVGHGEELPYLWNNDPNLGNIHNNTPSERLVKLWTNFAKTSNPTPAREDIFQNVTWPTSTFKNITYLDIGDKLTVTSDISHYNIQFWKDLYKNNGVPPYDTY